MANMGTFGLLIIIVNFIFSYKGFNDWQFFNQYKFNIGEILFGKDYKRLLTSGFLHVDWTHLLFNMFSFYSFGAILEQQLGGISFLLLYFVSLLAGNVFAIIIHKNNQHYSAVGASGAVSGIIFAAIALFPEIRIGLLFLPIGIPSWLFGLLYVGYSIYGIKANNDNIGHEAHLGGAFAGMLVAILLYPHALFENYIPILLTIVPSAVFLFIALKRPNLLR